jgi:pyruvate-ferredoxin/flavodoxin oxidoreductase
MTERKFKTLDGNEAVGSIAYRLNEVIAIYPITPASPMGEWADAWMAEGRKNIWGTVPQVYEMQSEGGAAAAVHGALQTGALSTTFTASQGLLLMIPNMFKIAGELTPTVFHIAARSLATEALSIFGDHSDVMSARSTGWAMLCSASVQETMDMALIAHAATLETRVPFLHFFDGFRTSHEIQKIEILSDDDLKAMVSTEAIAAHRARALSPDHPVLRGTAQNPDVYFQAREASNPFYAACGGKVQEIMDRFARLAGRQYKLFDYYGATDADRVVVLMGSGTETVHETVDYLNNHGERVGVVKVRLYRPFDVQRFMEALPATMKVMAVLDRTKEPGSMGEPLYLDCVTALNEGLEKGWGQLKKMPMMRGGRYGLSSKEFTPAMVKGVFDQLKSSSPKNHFTIGINDDVSHTSIDYDPSFALEDTEVKSALFYGLGSDGTVGANKNSIKIISEHTNNQVQAYFVYDSRKAGAVTVSHLRFSPQPIRSPYLVTKAQFLGCHQPTFLERYDMLQYLAPGGTFLLNTAASPETVWNEFPRDVQEKIINLKARVFVIDAYRVVKECGLGRRINTVMQVCYFAIANILPKEEAMEAIKGAIRKTYSNKGEEIVNVNMRAVDATLNNLVELKIPVKAEGTLSRIPPVPQQAPEFVRNILGQIMEGRGDELPVSALPVDGTFPTATTKWEKRSMAQDIPVWDPAVCIQCNKCAIVCPHSVIRVNMVDPEALKNAPASFKSVKAMDRAWPGKQYVLEISPDDCTGCGICVEVCPAKNKSATKFKAINMTPLSSVREQEIKNWDYFQSLPEIDRRKIQTNTVRQQQLQRPLFEFSSACPGCGETPYLKLLSQLFGDRAIIANATGCSSIYGGNLPTTPWCQNREGRGPAWANSLFEDNAEFGLGYRLSVDKQTEFAQELLKKLSGSIGDELVKGLLEANQKDEAGIYEQRARVAELKKKLNALNVPEAKLLASVADMLVRKSVWIVGGDGWAYDIGFGGLDHVLASKENVKILVLDTEVYSNTGGQASKSTPRGAVAKFAAAGKTLGKKDLARIAMSYGHVYVASVAMGAKDEQTLKAFIEAEEYDGPALIIAYSHCIAQGINMTTAMQVQKASVDAGQWLLFRFDPRRTLKNENPLVLDCAAPTLPLETALYMQNRFKVLTKTRPDTAKELLQQSEKAVRERRKIYEHIAARPMVDPKPEGKANGGTASEAVTGKA